MKLQRDWRLAPWMLVASIIGGLAVAVVSHFSTPAAPAPIVLQLPPVSPR
jgi:hypothetical protein